MDWILAIISGLQLGGNIAQNVSQNKASFKNKVKQNVLNYKSALTNANEALTSAVGEYNKVKDNISTKYGSSVFSLLERQYNKVNGIGANAVTRGTLNKYNVETDANGNAIGSEMHISMFKRAGDQFDSNLQGVDITNDGNYDKHHFNTDDTTSIIDQLYNSLSSGNTAIAQELRLSGNQLSAMLNNAQDEVNQSMATYRSNISQSALQLHSQNLNNALEIASARSTMASSGIRNTGTGNVNENLTQLQADITSAYYAMNIKAQAMQLQNEVYNTQKTASLSAYQSRVSTEYSKRQYYEKVVGAYGEGAYNSERYASKSNDYAEQANEYVDYDKELKEAGWWQIVTEG